MLLGLGLLTLAGCVLFRQGVPPPRGPPTRTVRMEVTGYCPCRDCCGWHRNWRLKPVFSSGPLRGQAKRIGQTASGSMARYGTIAADTSRYPFGTILYVPGYGYGRVEDCGSDIVGDRLDVFFSRHSTAEHWGRQRLDVKVWLPR